MARSARELFEEAMRLARPGKLFTASRDLMVAEVATLNPEARRHLIESVVAILGGSNNR